ncbi:MAG TPA: phage tail family protein [Bacillota bacterium]|nr:phage tail family protein [Bacillota bacterium]
MFKLEYTNSKNKTIRFYDRPYRLVLVEGIGGVAVENTLQKTVNQDGASLVNSSLEPRTISITLKIVGENRAEIERMRGELAGVFNPRLGEGTLTYVGGKTRAIKCIVDATPYFPDGQGNRGNTFQKVQIELIAPDPFWMDAEDKKEELVSKQGGLTFPLVLPTRFATLGDNRIHFDNEGDVDAPIKIEIKGTATRPKLMLEETGEFLQIKEKLTSDDTVVITTGFGNKRVEKNGENAFNVLQLPESVFFNLRQGHNVIKVTTDDTSDDIEVNILYKNRYLEV